MKNKSNKSLNTKNNIWFIIIPLIIGIGIIAVILYFVLRKKCPKDDNNKECSGNGTCKNGKCQCSSKYTGDKCDIRQKCSNNDDCNSDEKCSNTKCIKIDDCIDDNDCNKNFICNTKNKCVCKPNFKTPDCKVCDDEHTGDNCEKKLCKTKCTENQQCDNTTGICVCKPKFKEPDCTKCSDSSYTGANCDQKICETQCSANQQCDGTTGKCICKPQFKEPDCINCIDGYTGSNCETKKCQSNNDCSNGQTCNQTSKICECKSGFHGIDCSKPNCNNTTNICKNNGICNADGTCSCGENFQGDLCEIIKCKNDNDCLNGTCDKNTRLCICKPNFKQPDCSSCDDDYTGNNCQIKKCKSNSDCSNNGDCNKETGLCTCYNLWHGNSCEKCDLKNQDPNYTPGKDEHYGDKDKCVCQIGYGGDKCNSTCSKDTCKLPNCIYDEYNQTCKCKDGWASDPNEPNNMKCTKCAEGRGPANDCSLKIYDTAKGDEALLTLNRCLVWNVGETEANNDCKAAFGSSASLLNNIKNDCNSNNCSGQFWRYKCKVDKYYEKPDFNVNDWNTNKLCSSNIPNTDKDNPFGPPNFLAFQ